MFPYLMVIAGLVLIFFEFYLPGAILGVLGAICIAVAVALFVVASHSLFASVLFIAGIIWQFLTLTRRKAPSFRSGM